MNPDIHPKKPCAACPFSRRTIPGALGGSHPHVYIGQVFAGMWLPCHKLYDKNVDPKQQDPGTVGQCAGAAIFRANCGIAGKMPDHIHALDPDSVSVFSGPVDFAAHHLRITHQEAARTMPSITGLALRELMGAQVRIVPRS